MTTWTAPRVDSGNLPLDPKFVVCCHQLAPQHLTEVRETVRVQRGRYDQERTLTYRHRFGVGCDTRDMMGS